MPQTAGKLHIFVIDTGGVGRPNGVRRPIRNPHRGAAELIRKIAIFFSAALVILIPGKVENKRKVATSISYVFNLYKSRPRVRKKFMISSR